METRTKKRKKLKVRNCLIFIVLIALIVGGIFVFKKIDFNVKLPIGNPKSEGYLASTNAIVASYKLEKKETSEEEVKEEFIKSDNLVRGKKIIYYPKETYTYEDKDYVKIEYDSKTYYVLKDNIKDNIKDTILEKELYVRTANNLLKTLDGSLGNLVNKGDKLEIIGYNKLLESGMVDYYKVKQGEEEGYYYGEYLVESEEEAKKNYDEEGNYKTHLERVGKLGGGSAGNLDYYPVEKPSFKDNKMPDEVYALYINGASGIKNNIDSYIEYAKTTKINAFVVDIKDNTVPAYKSEVYKELSPTNYKYANNSVEDYKEAIKKLKDNGFYVIGRITTFKDDYYALDNKDDAIGKKSGGLLQQGGSYWPSPYRRGVWEFTIKLAKEAVELCGFNEIQFDYVRFPDRLTGVESTIDYKNTYGEEKAQAIQRFLMYATHQLHEMGVYVSADVFGESSWGYVTAYGQYFPAISNVVDAISAMPYTDHFEHVASNWENPYNTMLTWGKTAALRQTETPTPAVARTWITAYDTPYWEPYVTYNGAMLEKQIEALYEVGLTGGYMTWNSGSNLSKYKTQFSAFNREYKK